MPLTINAGYGQVITVKMMSEITCPPKPVKGT